jgi:hypothetical protein
LHLESTPTTSQSFTFSAAAFIRSQRDGDFFSLEGSGKSSFPGSHVHPSHVTEPQDDPSRFVGCQHWDSARVRLMPAVVHFGQTFFHVFADGQLIICPVALGVTAKSDNETSNARSLSMSGLFNMHLFSTVCKSKCGYSELFFVLGRCADNDYAGTPSFVAILLACRPVECSQDELKYDCLPSLM